MLPSQEGEFRVLQVGLEVGEDEDGVDGGVGDEFRGRLVVLAPELGGPLVGAVLVVQGLDEIGQSGFRGGAEVEELVAGFAAGVAVRGGELLGPLGNVGGEGGGVAAAAF